MGRRKIQKIEGFMEGTDLDEISFDEVRTFNDVETMVWTGLLLNKEDFPAVEVAIRQSGLLKEGKLVNAKNISGNVLGDNGRCDVVLFFEGAVLGNPVARLRFDGLKWTTDFCVNFYDDYHC